MFRAVPVIFSVLFITILLIIIISFAANLKFNRKVKKEVKAFFDNVESEGDVIQKEDLKVLPLCVQRWLEYSQVIGKEKIKAVRLKQNAVMRLKEGQRWMPAKVEQYFKVDQPGFVWKAKVKMAPFIYFAGRDKYYKGTGNMLIKLLSLITVVNAGGKEIDQGTLLRYLAETMWFPTAALSSYISWEDIDENSAKATMSYGGVTASGVFTFNEKGEVINFIAERYGQFDGKYILATWSVLIRGYKEFSGIRIPVKGEVIWKLKTGDFNWYRFEVKEIEYNKPVDY